ncbi:uncharacterized protein LOC105229141 [Bactrocera dorsalis]|uniref:Uncharacterized protein LOC105229141 n=1 Tax=Bactrocera dorsalis TaxID=27457 RepID=A0A6I9VCY8_BACDO|nr:uncharacterized protein LOC105229141 [Bactrocera dorsalis]
MQISSLFWLLFIIVTLVIILIFIQRTNAYFNKNPTNGQSDITTNEPINSVESSIFNLLVETIIKICHKYDEVPFSPCGIQVNGDMQPKPEAPIKKNATNGQSNSTTNEPINSLESANSKLPVKPITKSLDKYHEKQCLSCGIKVIDDMGDKSPILMEPNQFEYLLPSSSGEIALRPGQWVLLLCADGFAERFDGQTLLAQYIGEKNFIIKNQVRNFSNIFFNFLIKNKIANFSNRFSKFLIKNKIINFSNKFSNFIIKNKIVIFSYKFLNFLIKNKIVNFSNKFSQCLLKKEIVNFLKKKLRFFIKNIIVNFSKIMCKTTSTPTPLRTGLCCSGEGTEWIYIGNKFNDSFLITMKVCFDKIRQTTLYVEHKITPGGIHYRKHVPRKNFTCDDFFGGRNIDPLYRSSKQIKALKRILGKDVSIYVTAKNYLSRGHLVAKADLIFSGQQKSTFYYVNVVPQWQSFNAGNWSRIEDGVRQFAHDSNSTLLCWTGTWGVCTLPDVNNIQQELYLGDKNNVIRVPKLFYRIVIDAESRKGITFVGVNNPYVAIEELTIGGYLIGEDISHNINWINWERQNIEKGYCYACSVPDFVEVVKGLPLVDLETTGILGLKE